LANGVISGAVLRAARKTAGLTQEQLAGALGTDPDTVKGWESGRRALARVKAGRLAQVRRRLRSLGARAHLLALLEPAVDADDFTARAIEGDCGPLANDVITRPWTGLVAWAAAGDVPSAAADVAAKRALLSRADAAAFFASVRQAADRAPAAESGMLLRRQAYYLAAWDASPNGIAWLGDAGRAVNKQLRLTGKWSPGWPVARSLAVAQSHRGDREPLRAFIRRELADDACDLANLTYWAYWIGADAEPASDDGFMAERSLDTQQAAALLRHLARGLCAEQPYVELSVHAILSIVRRWPGLLGYDQRTAAVLCENSALLLDEAPLPAFSRKELSHVHLAASGPCGLLPGKGSR